MKKSLLALSILSMFAGVASAQTSVVIYGSFDGGVRELNNVATSASTVGNRLTMGSNGTYNSNRLGFRGTEDLGAGNNAHFLLEQGFNTGTGGSDSPATPRAFNRGAFVGLGGGWGSLDLGHQYTTVFKTMVAYEPFSYNYPAIVPVIAASGGNGPIGAPLTSANISNNVSRFSNDVQYTGTFGPITARAEHSFGEVAGSTRTGSADGVGVSYAGGPLALGGAYIKRKDGASASAPTFNYDVYTVGGAYTFGPARLTAGYNKQKQATTTVDTQVKLAWVGLNYDITPLFQLTGAYYRTKATAAVGDGKIDMYILGAKYLLSKRTNFYADIDNKKFAGIYRINATSVNPQDKQLGVSVGINHNF